MRRTEPASRLTDGGTGTGDYRAGDIALGFASIDRADVARCLPDCLRDDPFVHEAPNVGPA